MKKTLLFLLLAIFGLGRLYYYLTDDFRHSNITYEIPYQESWHTPLPEGEALDQLKEIMNQKFIYIGKGAQVYAFGSEDGRWVIKFFKFKHIRPSWIYQFYPPISPFKEYKEKQTARKSRKVYEIFKGYKAAYDHDRDPTGLIYLHLNKTEGLGLSVDLVDKLGLSHRFNLDDTIFVVQKRGVTLRERLKGLLAQNDLTAVKTSLDKIFSMYLEEYKAGLFDHDHGVTQNTGFIGEAPFHLDVGKFQYGEEFKKPQFYERDISWVALVISDWLEKNAPAQAGELTCFMSALLSEKLGRPIDLYETKKVLLQEMGKL